MSQRKESLKRKPSNLTILHVKANETQSETVISIMTSLSLGSDDDNPHIQVYLTYMKLSLNFLWKIICSEKLDNT